MVNVKKSLGTGGGNKLLEMGELRQPVLGVGVLHESCFCK